MVPILNFKAKVLHIARPIAPSPPPPPAFRHGLRRHDENAPPAETSVQDTRLHPCRGGRPGHGRVDAKDAATGGGGGGCGGGERASGGGKAGEEKPQKTHGRPSTAAQEWLAGGVDLISLQTGL